MINVISKPLLVDLLRTFDRNKWLTPRLRYASVRSKADLIADLKKHFVVKRKQTKIIMTPRRLRSRLPVILYDTAKKGFAIDGIVQDIPRENRKKPVFSLQHGPFVLYFDRILDCVRLSSLDASARQKVLASETAFREPNIGTLSDFGE